VDDVGDLVLGDRPLECVEVRDVGVDGRDAVELLGLEDQLEPRAVGGEVEADDRRALADEQPAGPRADRPERARYQEPLRRLRRP
jgi:hypothetical protein